MNAKHQNPFSKEILNLKNIEAESNRINEKLKKGILDKL